MSLLYGIFKHWAGETFSPLVQSSLSALLQDDDIIHSISREEVSDPSLSRLKEVESRFVGKPYKLWKDWEPEKERPTYVVIPATPTPELIAAMAESGGAATVDADKLYAMYSRLIEAAQKQPINSPHNGLLRDYETALRIYDSFAEIAVLAQSVSGVAALMKHRHSERFPPATKNTPA